MLEDDRTGLTVDAHDQRAGQLTAGRRVRQPSLMLWSTRDDLAYLYGDPLRIWRDWADNLTEHANRPRPRR